MRIARQQAQSHESGRERERREPGRRRSHSGGYDDDDVGTLEPRRARALKAQFLALLRRRSEVSEFLCASASLYRHDVCMHIYIYLLLHRRRRRSTKTCALAQLLHSAERLALFGVEISPFSL